MLSEFRTKPYRSNRIKDYQQRMQRARGEDKKVVDKVMVSILKQQGYSWSEDSSSTYDPQALYDALANYAPSRNTFVNTNTPEWKRAIDATFSIYAKPKNHLFLAPLTDYGKMAKALKMSKSAGLPMMTKKEDDFYYAINRANQVLEGIKRPAPCVAYHRTQLGSKTRLVWGYPFEMTILEARFARPLINKFLILNTPMAFGLSKWEIGARVQSIDEDYGQTYGLDFSKFDSSIPRHLIKIAFSILSTWFTEQDKKDFGWDKIVDYFLYTPIVMPNGKLYTGKTHGVPSGSYFTQFVDSVVNTMIQFWLAETHGYSVNERNLLVLGDDVLLSIPEEVDLQAISSSVNSIGMVLHPDKTERRAHFLGAVWIKGIPYRDTHELLKKMVYPERYRHYPSTDYRTRLLLVFLKQAQYASSYANAFEMLRKFMKTNNVDAVDRGLKSMRQQARTDWSEDERIGALQYVSLKDPELEAVGSLGALLMA